MKEALDEKRLTNQWLCLDTSCQTQHAAKRSDGKGREVLLISPASSQKSMPAIDVQDFNGGHGYALNKVSLYFGGFN